MPQSQVATASPSQNAQPNHGMGSKVLSSDPNASLPPQTAYYASPLHANSVSLPPSHLPRSTLHPLLSQQQQPAQQSPSLGPAQQNIQQPPSVSIASQPHYAEAIVPIQQVLQPQQYRQLPPNMVAATNAPQQHPQLQRMMPILSSNQPIQQLPLPNQASPYIPVPLQQQQQSQPQQQPQQQQQQQQHQQPQQPQPPQQPLQQQQQQRQLHSGIQQPVSTIVSQNGTYYSIPAVNHPMAGQPIAIAPVPAPNQAALPPIPPQALPANGTPNTLASPVTLPAANSAVQNAQPVPMTSSPAMAVVPQNKTTATSTLAAQQGANVLPPNAPESVRHLISLNEETWIQIGRLAELFDDQDKALSAYESALRQNPYSIPAMLQIATILRNREQFPLAIEYYQTILDCDPKQGEIWSALGHCYLMQDDLSRAYSAYRQALYHLKDPKDPKLWYGIGILYDRYGSHEHAEEAFMQCLRMDPNFEKVNEIYFRLGIIYKQQHKFAQSLELFRHILDNPPKPLTVLDIYFQIGHVYEQRKEYKLAKEAYERVLAETPNHAKVLQQLGWLCHQQSSSFTNQDLAIQYLTKSLEADDTDAQSWYLIGRCYVAQQKYNKAYEAYQQAVYRDGRNPTFWCSIGVLYYQINQYQDALDAYSRAIRLNPYISEVWYDLGTLYESCHNQISDALDAYQRAAELDPTNPHIKARLQLLRGPNNEQHKIVNAPPSNVPNVQTAKYINQPGVPYSNVPVAQLSGNWQPPHIPQAQLPSATGQSGVVQQPYQTQPSVTNNNVATQPVIASTVPVQTAAPSSQTAVPQTIHQSNAFTPRGKHASGSRNSISSTKSPQHKLSDQPRSRNNSISNVSHRERSNSVSSKSRETRTSASNESDPKKSTQRDSSKKLENSTVVSGSPSSSSKSDAAKSIKPQKPEPALKPVEGTADPKSTKRNHQETEKTADTDVSSTEPVKRQKTADVSDDVGEEEVKQPVSEQVDSAQLTSEPKSESLPKSPEEKSDDTSNDVTTENTNDINGDSNMDNVATVDKSTDAVDTSTATVAATTTTAEEELPQKESQERSSPSPENQDSTPLAPKSVSPKQAARTLDIDENYDDDEGEKETVSV